jgi:glycosyltransferase involved in cell wall biosynthesis
VKVLFISHDASRSGAPLLLLRFLRWLRAAHSSVSFRILLKNGGELAREFGEAGTCTTLHWDESRPRPLFHRLRRRRALAGHADVDVVYSNTITNGAVMAELAQLGRPVITHVHELENYVHSSGSANLDMVKRHTTLFIAASRAVKENLVSAHGVDDGRVAVVHSFLPVELCSPGHVTRPREQVLAELGIPADALVVGASGTTDWRKSPDLFVQLAARVRRAAPTLPIHFLWVGGALSWELRYDIEKLGAFHVSFVPHTDRPLDYFNCMDLFALVSRVDPFPLVCLEAASLGKPVLCFADAGGMPEFVEDDCGFVVPYLDLDAMGDRVLALHADPQLRLTLGVAAQRKVRARHDVGVAGAQIVELMGELATRERR